MAFLRLLLILASSAFAAFTAVSIAQPSSPRAATGDQLAPHSTQLVHLNFDYQLAGNPSEILVQERETISTTIPEPPIGASLAGAAMLGLVVWTRRRRG